MRNYLRERRERWAHSPHRRLILIINASLSVLAILVFLLRVRYLFSGTASWSVVPIVVLVTVWLKYGYDRMTSGPGT